MPCDYARFVIHYKDGTTLIEDRNDPYSWDHANKNGIRSLGIIFRPIFIPGIQNVALGESTLIGSSKHDYQFFQFKDAEQKLVRGAKANVLGLIIGMVVDRSGRCVCVTGKPNLTTKTFFTTVHSLGLNLELFGMDLSKLPE